MQVHFRSTSITIYKAVFPLLIQNPKGEQKHHCKDGRRKDIYTHTPAYTPDGCYYRTVFMNGQGIQTYKEEQNEQEKLRGTFQVLDGNILMFIHPSSGDNIFYKVRDDNNIILIDSFGNEPKKEDRKNYILKKR